MLKLQAQRLKVGMSQRQLAEASGVKLLSIQKYEIANRRIDGASLETLCALASAMGCTIYDILESDDLIEQLKNVT